MTLDDSRESMQVIPRAVGARIVSTTLVIVLATNLFLAPLTGPLLRCLGLKSAGTDTRDDAMAAAALAAMPLISEAPSINDSGAQPATDNAAARESHGESRARRWKHLLKHFEHGYLRPVFGGRPDGTGQALS